MPKQCQFDGCEFNVWGKGFCKRHQYLRPDKKPDKLKVRQYSKKQRFANWGFDNESDMFEWIWENREHRCYLTGSPLDQYEGTDFFHNLFAHVLPKAQNAFPLFRLNPDNVVFLRPDLHLLADQGSQDQRDKAAKEQGFSWQKLQDKADELMADYRLNYDKSCYKKVSYVCCCMR